MKLNELKPAPGSNQSRRRVGRGAGSGRGKTCGRGNKGQKARSGGKTGLRTGFEGGQMPLQRRLPKVGFRNPTEKEFAEVQVAWLNRYDDGSEVDPDTLLSDGIVSKLQDGVVILGNDKLEVSLDVSAHRVTSGARASIEEAGGSVSILS